MVIVERPSVASMTGSSIFLKILVGLKEVTLRIASDPAEEEIILLQI